MSYDQYDDNPPLLWEDRVGLAPEDDADYIPTDRHLSTFQPKPPKYPIPERRAKEYGFRHEEHQIVGRWLADLLKDAPHVKDCLDFWRACQLIAHLADPIENQTELAARLGISQQRVSQLLVKICAKLAEIAPN